MPKHLFAIHGFLGTSHDWVDIQGWIQGEWIQEQINGGDHTFDISSFPDNEGLWGWASAFNQKIDPNQDNILMGYSLGGRLALHALLHSPHLWSSAIIISAHPGLQKEEERQQRLVSDTRWAERFRSDDWNEVIAAWNRQPVFSGGGSDPERQEEDCERERLAALLVNFSLGKQGDLRKGIQEAPIPILWVVGERDKKYVHLSHSLRFKHPLSQQCVIPKAAHRVPWDNPKAFVSQVNRFLSNIVT